MAKKQHSTTVIVSQGDVAGIGWEILLRLLEHKNTYFKTNELAWLKKLVIVGDLFLPDEKRVKKIFDIREAPDDAKEIQQILLTKKSTKPLFLLQQSGKSYQPGSPSSSLALRSYQAFQRAIKYVLALENSSLLTLPVSKEYISKAGVFFSGHTEILAAATKQDVYMCLYHPKLSVVPLTNHIPLSRVAKKILEINYEALTQALFFFKELTATKKKFAITGLNPHAGEDGLVGNEESFLRTKVELLHKHGLSIDGPLPADGVFSVQARGAYSLIVTCYHDQGLVPFKALFGLKGINITLNLPFLRVSPDHGTAYSLAGKGMADPTGVLMSLKFAFTKGTLWRNLYSSQ